jgi:hypothetical protein
LLLLVRGVPDAVCGEALLNEFVWPFPHPFPDTGMVSVPPPPGGHVAI